MKKKKFLFSNQPGYIDFSTYEVGFTLKTNSYWKYGYGEGLIVYNIVNPKNFNSYLTH